MKGTGEAMTTTLSIAASGLRHQQQRLNAAAHNTANVATPPSTTMTLRANASEADDGGVKSQTSVTAAGDFLSAGILPLLTAPDDARGLAQVIRAQDEMSGILLDITA